MTEKKKEYRICSRGVWDTTVPGITFDENGVSNYARMFDNLCDTYPRGEQGKRDWEIIINKIKERGRDNKYDCIIGVSGGTDSCYLLHLAKNIYGLRPLAVNLDNGWSSDISVKNIKKITKALDIDLETFVIDYEEVVAVLGSYIKASLPWADSPTDLAIKAILYKTAQREGIQFILNGSDFRSEGKQPTSWTYSDAKQMKYLIKKFSRIKLKTYPYYTLTSLYYYGAIRGIKVFRPYYYLDYQKKTAQEFLINNYDWEYYGGHHHENIFTKFIISYWMPKKFNIDKRIITYSAQILSGEITRNFALEQIKNLPYDHEKMEIDKHFVIKKLNFSVEEFNRYLNLPNKYYFDYPSYLPMLKKYGYFTKKISEQIFPFKPSILFEKLQ